MAPSSQHSPTSAPAFPTRVSSSSSSASDAPLPFPSALPRSDFLVPDFDPVAYLSSMPHRHQTLEDLRGELRDRSAAITTELLELVNSNYTAFLSLGNELKGGDDKVEDVKVSLMAFRRQAQDIKAKVRARCDETSALNRELAKVRAGIETARKMMDLFERLAALEERLSLDSNNDNNNNNNNTTNNNTNSAQLKNRDETSRDWSGGWEESADDHDSQEWGDNEYEAGFVGSSPAKLLSWAQDYQHMVMLVDELGKDTPFVVKMEERLIRCRNTIILDLNSALRDAKKVGASVGGIIVKYLAIYRLLDAQSDAIKVVNKA